MTVTERLARFVEQARFEDLSTQAINVAKMGIADCTGVMLAGAREPGGRIIGEFARAAGGAPLCTVVGHGFQTSPVTAALANGTAAHALDYDDVNWALLGHPSVVMVPAAFAVGESLGRSGGAVIEAYAVGVEVAAKLGRCAMPVHSSRGGWHATGTLACFGAVAASAKLLGLSAHQVAAAFGIVASMASGICSNFGTMTKPLHAGHAAQNGVTGALLAQRGFTAGAEVFDDPRGFFAVYCRDLPIDTGVFAGLGQPHELERSGLVIKPYPCGVAAHPAVDALLELMQTQAITADLVDRIDVGATSYTFEKLKYPLPETGLQGKFSMPYILARVLCDGRLTLDTFTDNQARDPRIRRMAERIHMHVDPKIEEEWRRNGGSRPCAVTVRLTGGQTHSALVKISKGNPQRALTAEELKHKYLDCAGRALPSEAAGESWRLLSHLEDLDNIRPLLSALSGAGTQTTAVS